MIYGCITIYANVLFKFYTGKYIVGYHWICTFIFCWLFKSRLCYSLHIPLTFSIKLNKQYVDLGHFESNILRKKTNPILVSNNRWYFIDAHRKRITLSIVVIFINKFACFLVDSTIYRKLINFTTFRNEQRLALWSWKERLFSLHFRTIKIARVFILFVLFWLLFATVQKCRSTKRVWSWMLSLIMNTVVNELRFKNNHAQLFIYHYYYYFNVLLAKWLFVVCQYNRSIYRLATSQWKSKKQ